MKHENAVLQGLENMRVHDGHGGGLLYSINETNYSTDEIILEIKNDTPVGNEFLQNVYDTILSYMGKFTQNINCKNYNNGNDCDCCENQYLCVDDGDAVGCRCADAGDKCTFIQLEIMFE